MIPATYWVIRHKPTGTFMPSGLPITSFDFTAPLGVYEPRLYSSARIAKCSATFWSKGIWTKNVRTESEGWGYRSYTVEDAPSPQIATPSRKRDDLEVLEVILSFKETP